MIKGLGTAFIGPILVLAILGTVLGVSLGNTELFNPATSAAQARSMDVQTEQVQLENERQRVALAIQWQAAMLELEHQSAVNAENQKSLQDQHALQLQAQQQAFERKMAWMETQQSILLGVGVGAILVVTIAVAYYLYACGQAGLLQVAHTAGRYRAASPEQDQYPRQPISVLPRKPIAPQDRQATRSYEEQPGGNGRGPHVHSYVKR